MIRVLFNFVHLGYDLIADDSDEAIVLIDSDYKKITSIGYNWGFNKRDIIGDIKRAVIKDIEENCHAQFTDYLKGCLERDIQLLREAQFWTPKSDKKRTTKSDVIKYLKAYKYKHFERGNNYWTSCAPYIDNCIKALREG